MQQRSFNQNEGHILPRHLVCLLVPSVVGYIHSPLCCSDGDAAVSPSWCSQSCGMFSKTTANNLLRTNSHWCLWSASILREVKIPPPFARAQPHANHHQSVVLGTRAWGRGWPAALFARRDSKVEMDLKLENQVGWNRPTSLCCVMGSQTARVKSGKTHEVTFNSIPPS